jgi:FkbM family methyltransferase
MSNDTFNHEGLRWPKYDHNPTKNLAFVRKGIQALEITIELCNKKRTVFQAGGHVGMWPLRLARSFERVYTFEPEPALYKCLVTNTRNYSNIITLRSALGHDLQPVRLRPSRSAGTWRVESGPEGTVEVPQTTIDAACRNDVDCIILDIEGYEVNALRGAAETIARCRPIIHVELLPRSKEAIERHLAGLGYKVYREYGNDRIYEPGEATPWR